MDPLTIPSNPRKTAPLVIPIPTQNSLRGFRFSFPATTRASTNKNGERFQVTLVKAAPNTPRENPTASTCQTATDREAAAATDPNSRRLFRFSVVTKLHQKSSWFRRSSAARTAASVAASLTGVGCAEHPHTHSGGEPLFASGGDATQGCPLRSLAIPNERRMARWQSAYNHRQRRCRLLPPSDDPNSRGLFLLLRRTPAAVAAKVVVSVRGSWPPTVAAARWRWCDRRSARTREKEREWLGFLHALGFCMVFKPCTLLSSVGPPLGSGSGHSGSGPISHNHQRIPIHARKPAT